MTARERDDRTNSENFLSAMQTSKKSLSKSTVYQEEAEELRKISQDRSRTYSGHIEKTSKGELKMNINGTDC